MSDRFAATSDVEVRRDGPLAAVIGIGAAALRDRLPGPRVPAPDGGWLGLGADWRARRHRRCST